MNIAHWLGRTAQEYGDQPAIFLGTELNCRYDELEYSVRQISTWLQGLGVKPGDRVALFMLNHPDYLRLLFAIWYSGGVAVPINAKLHAKEAFWIIDNSEAKFTFASQEQSISLLKVCGDLGRNINVFDLSGGILLEVTKNCAMSSIFPRNSSDLAWLFFTSGTTGRPKGVMITHGMLKSMAMSYLADVDTVLLEDVTLYSAPFSHGAGLYSIIHVLKPAGHVFPVTGGFDSEEILAISEHFKSVHMFAAPTMVKRLTAASKARGIKPTGLRTIVYAGGPMYKADIIEALDWFGPIFVQIYGQGECPMAITALSRQAIDNRSHPRWEARLTSVGIAQSDVEVQIWGETGQPVTTGQSGEIMVRGDPVMPGYWRNTKASNEALQNGWLRTGDIGIMDSEGYITLKDRSKDLIISGGSNIYPREVEEVLLMHASIAEAAVVGRKHIEWGEEVVAFIVVTTAKNLSAETLSQFCRQHIAAFKLPKAYIVIEALPKNNYGKILKRDLRNILKNQSTIKYLKY